MAEAGDATRATTATGRGGCADRGSTGEASSTDAAGVMGVAPVTEVAPDMMAATAVAADCQGGEEGEEGMATSVAVMTAAVVDTTRGWDWVAAVYTNEDRGVAIGESARLADGGVRMKVIAAGGIQRVEDMTGMTVDVSVTVLLLLIASSGVVDAISDLSHAWL